MTTLRKIKLASSIEIPYFGAKSDILAALRIISFY